MRIDARRDRGEMPYEALAAMVCLTVAMIAMMSLLITVTRSALTYRAWSKVDVILHVDQADIDAQIPNGAPPLYTDCATPATYNSGGAAAIAWTGQQPGFTSTITSVKYWNGSAFTTTCTESRQSPEAQDITVTVAAAGGDFSQGEDVVVVNPNAPAGLAASVTPTYLAFVTQPSLTWTGQAIAPSVQVAIEDQYGNVITGDSSTVTLALNPVSDDVVSSALSTCTGSEASGVVTFPNCTVNGAGTFDLVATDTSDALTGTSSDFDVEEILDTPATTAFNSASDQKGAVTVSFTPSANAGPGQVYLGYACADSQGESGCITVQPFTSGGDITGLTPGALYYVGAEAVGTGDYTDSPRAPSGPIVASTGAGCQAGTLTNAPAVNSAAISAPYDVTAARASATSAQVSWTAPDWSSGNTVTSYTVTTTDLDHPASGGQSYTVTGSPAAATCLVPNLTAGDHYTFSVTAATAAASSVASEAGPIVAGGALGETNDGGATYSADATAFDDGVFVSVGAVGVSNSVPVNLGTVVDTLNGTPTSVATTGVVGALTQVTACTGVFVGVESGTANGAYSNNGTTWTTVTLPFSATWTGLACHGNTVVATTSSTVAAVSTNAGGTWTQVSLPAVGSAVAYADGEFLVLGTGSSTTASVSTNATTWSTITMPSRTLTLLAGSGSTFIAGSGTSSTVYSSSNGGSSWTSASLPSATNFNSAAFDDNQWIAFTTATNGASTGGAIDVSVDGGASWVEGPALYGEAQEAAVGDGVVLVPNSSLNATPQTNTVLEPLAPSYDVTTSSVAVAAQYNFSSPTRGNSGASSVCSPTVCLVDVRNVWYSSTSGALFSALTTSLPGPVIYGGGQFVSYSQSAASALVSTNGVTWSAIALPTTPVNMVYGDGELLMTTSSSTIYTSTTLGQSWTAGSGGVAGPSSLTYANGFFENADVYSANGTTWTTFTGVGNGEFTSISYAGSLWFAYSAYNQAMAYSTNGSNWTWENYNAYGVNSAPAYGNGVYVTDDGSSSLYYSTNGVTWSTLNQTNADMIAPVTFGDGQFEVVAGGVTNNGSAWVGSAFSPAGANSDSVAPIANNGAWALFGGPGEGGYFVEQTWPYLAG